MAGAVVRVYLVPDIGTFRVVAGLLLLLLGVFVLARPRIEHHPRAIPMSRRRVTALASAVGIAAGVYGIGGGSIIGPILVGRGLLVTAVALAALATTFVTSIAGAITYALLALIESGPIAPEWSVGLACGFGGLIGGYAGAGLQPKLPEKALRGLLGAIAIALGLAYLVRSL